METDFAELYAEAEERLRTEPDFLGASWLVRSMHGLRRAGKEAPQVTAADQTLWLDYSHRSAGWMKQLGLGYRAGLALDELAFRDRFFRERSTVNGA